VTIVENINTIEEIPLLPIREIVIFPYMVITLIVGRKSSIRAVESALASDNLIFLSCQQVASVEDPKEEDIYSIGTVATIVHKTTLSDGKLKIRVQGLIRSKIGNFKSNKSFFTVMPEEIISDDDSKDIYLTAKIRHIKDRLIFARDLDKPLISDLIPLIETIEEPSKITDIIAANLGLKIGESQELLEIISNSDRLDRLLYFINRDIAILEVQQKIFVDAKGEIDKNQRIFFLKEQLKVIKRELGEEDILDRENSDYQKKIRKAKMSKEVKKVAEKQLSRLNNMYQDSAEANIIRNYLDLLTELPWGIKTEDNLDIANATKVLESDHYGLEEVKDRVLDFLALRELNKNMKSPIICLVGPPGVGKTSLGRSIAKAMGRNFLRISMGGIKDEAEIRGHRRTYVGALPGKIIQGLRTVGSKNPVFILDEIDKVGSDFRGDPASALLEVLDPVQNSTFTDHYLSLPFDLSEVLFITTANVLDSIPLPLQDRMEIINIPGYTEEEKTIIAEKYIIDRQIKENGLTKDQIVFEKKAIMKMIFSYTRESGLRNFDQLINKVCRKVGRNIVEGKYTKFTVTAENLPTILGPEKYLDEDEFSNNEIGIATGLAWTAVGGEVLFIECTKYKGKGNLIITGMLGDVMKESSQAALSFVKTVSGDYGVDFKVFTENDFHVHIPAGAIPKDGPSAGITIATAILSTVLSKRVRRDISMTGEITITGRVLPIGGLKEKLLAAKRIGSRVVIIPKSNCRDLSKIPNYIKKSIKIIGVDNFKDVVRIAISDK